MEDSLDFKSLWQQRNMSAPDLSLLKDRLIRYKKQSLRRLLVLNLCLAATCAFTVFIWLHYQPELLSTKLGIILVIVAMLGYMLFANGQLEMFSKLDSGMSNSAYLQQLLKVKQSQKQLHTWILSLYFLLLSVGICLYLYEYARRMSVLGAWTTYGLTLVWIGLNWFYFRPRSIRKQQAKLDDLIQKISEIDGQLNAY